ncbi:MAG: threonine--tRNA ligase [Candidatus Dojkabacteria bacterium]|nr:threonine--tRNA ligase [Candidatus Dojkabacteria bacterium]
MQSYLHKLRHSTEHVFNQALEELYPGKVKRAIGPVIDNGWYFDGRLDFEISPECFEKIEKKMKEIIDRDLPFVKVIVSPSEARRLFKDNEFKLELIDDLERNGEEISIYYTGDPNDQSTTFFDLCAGPHVERTSEIKYFKVLSIAGAYWRGDSKREMLTRIYGTTFETEQELKQFLYQRELAEKINHRKIGKELELFAIFPEIGQGLPVWLPNGYVIRRILEDYMLKLEKKYDYLHILTPHINNEILFETSGHLHFYKDSMYSPIEIDNQRYYLKPMNCPAAMMVYKMKIRSYKDLPYKLGELGTVYRYEQSGELQGLQRVRGFTQNDAHIFCTLEQVEQQFLEVLEMLTKFYQDLGFTNYKYRLSLSDFEKNPDKYVGEKETWYRIENVIRNVLSKNNIQYYEAKGEAAFYGPKLDVQAVNVFGKEDTISTIQIDFNLPHRFGLEYVDKDGTRKVPVVIHRALVGSFERFFAFLIEFYEGSFPVWLSPIQVAVLPISTIKHLDFATEVTNRLKQKEIRVELFKEEETLNYRIRMCENKKIPYIVIIGEQEIQTKILSVRLRNRKTVKYKIEDLENEIFLYTNKQNI